MRLRDSITLKLIFNWRTLAEVLLIVFIPFFNMGSNTLVEKLAEISGNYTIPNFLIILFQMFFSMLVIFAIYSLEKNQDVANLKTMFVSSLSLTFIVYMLRLIAFASRGLVGIVFSRLSSYSSFGVETVFLVSIPVVKVLSSFMPYLGILFIIFLRSLINLLIVLPMMSFTLQKIGDAGVFITLYVSQFLVMLFFAKLPFNMSKMPFSEALKASIFKKDKHFNFILFFSSLYAFIVAAGVMSLRILRSQYVFPAMINFIELYMLLAFFVAISKEEIYG